MIWRKRRFSQSFLWLWIILCCHFLAICPAVAIAAISTLAGFRHCKQQTPGQCVHKGDLYQGHILGLCCCVKELIFDESEYQLSAWICVCDEQWEKDAAYFWPVGLFHSYFSAEMFSLCKWKEDVSRKSICSALTCTPSGSGASSTPSFQLWGVQICSAKLSASLPIFSHSSDGSFLWLVIALLLFF